MCTLLNIIEIIKVNCNCVCVCGGICQVKEINHKLLEILKRQINTTGQKTTTSVKIVETLHFVIVIQIYDKPRLFL